MCELYFVPLDSGIDPPLTQRLLGLFQEEQRENIRRIRQDNDRQRSLCAHLLVRALACRILGAANTALYFAADGQGKPYLRDQTAFGFSVSHTDHAVAVAVASRPVGVDLERPRAANLRIASRFFTPGESDYVLCPENGRDRRFFEIWTQKEACVKWMGGSLAASLGSLDVLSAEWSGMLRSYEREGYLISLCAENPGEARAPRLLSQTELVTAALTLEPYITG